MQLLLRLLLPVLLTSSVTAQQGPPPAADGWAVEIQSRHRWLHGHQGERFTPLLEERRWIAVDSTRPGPVAGQRAYHLTVDWPGRDISARLVLGPAGDAVRVEAALPERPRLVLTTPADSIRSLRYALANGGEGVRLPESGVWELLPTLRPSRLEQGARWLDTLDLAARHDGVRTSLRGERVHEVVGDTTIGGRRLWIVRDSALVQLTERWLEHERTLDTIAVVERTARGVIRGRSLLDPALDFARARSDTTTLSGEAVLTYPDGRTFRTPARYERTRRWALHDSTSREARLAALRQEAAAGRTGMVILPTDDLERRLSRGDEALRDSLLAAWRREADPNARARLFGLLDLWGTQSQEFRDHLRELGFLAGDTVQKVRSVLSVPSPRDPLTGAGVELLLPFLRDPGLAFAFGLDRDPFYENLRQGLLQSPPALATDTAAWPCTPAACRTLAAQWEAATEPRLRDLGLIARLVMDPAQWSDEVLARAEAGSAVVQPAVLLIHGVGATWTSASKAPVPTPEAHWRDWLEWMNGMDPAFRARHPNPPATTQLRFEESHATALRFDAARTGRDVVGELQRKLREAPGDSARLIYDTILLGLGARQPDAAAVAERLLGGSPAERERARGEMRQLFSSAQPADSALAVELTDRLLAIVIEGAAPWPPLESPQKRSAWGLRRLAEPHDSIFVVSDSLPPAVQARWEDRVRVVSREVLRGSELVPGIQFRVSCPVQVGPFARLGVNYSAYVRGEGEQTLSGYAGGITVYLVRSAEGWLLVHASEWIT